MRKGKERKVLLEEGEKKGIGKSLGNELLAQTVITVAGAFSFFLGQWLWRGLAWFATVLAEGGKGQRGTIAGKGIGRRVKWEREREKEEGERGEVRSKIRESGKQHRDKLSSARGKI
jgi:hypothetical protein